MYVHVSLSYNLTLDFSSSRHLTLRLWLRCLLQVGADASEDLTRKNTSLFIIFLNFTNKKLENSGLWLQLLLRCRCFRKMSLVFGKCAWLLVIAVIKAASPGLVEVTDITWFSVLSVHRFLFNVLLTLFCGFTSTKSFLYLFFPSRKVLLL